MKKIFLIILIFFIILAFHNIIYANNIENTADEFDYSEYESHHMLEHQNAEVCDKFNTYAPIIMFMLIVLNSVVFCVLSKKLKKITFKYFIVLLLFLISYIMSYSYINNKYPSQLTIIPINQHIIMDVISISIIFSLFTKSNKSRLFLSLLPAVIMMMFLIFSSFMSYVNIKILFEDLLSALNYFLIIEIYSQVILCPIYLYNKKNNTKTELVL